MEQSQRRNVSAGLRWKRRWTNELRSADAASNVITFLKTRRRCWQKSRTVFTTGNMFAGGMLAVSTFFLLLLTPISITSPLTSPLHLTAFSTAGCQSLHNMGRPSSSERNQKLSFRLPCFATPQRAVIPLRTLTALRDAGRGQRRGGGGRGGGDMRRNSSRAVFQRSTNPKEVVRREGTVARRGARGARGGDRGKFTPRSSQASFPLLSGSTT